MSKDDPLAGILSELEGPRIAVPKRRVVSLPKPLVAPKGVVGSGLGTGSMDPRGNLSRRLIVDDGGVGLGQIETARAQGEYMDEIDAYLENKARAARVTGGDDFLTRVQMQKHAVQDLHTEAPFQRTNPGSMLNGIVGNQISIVGLGVAAGAAVYSEPKQVAQWAGKDIEATAVTVLFGPVGIFPVVTTAESSPVIGTRGARPVGIILFGTSGYILRAEVDILTGCQFTVSASYVRLEAMVAGLATKPLNVTGMLSFGTSVRTAPLTRSVYWNALANATTSGTMLIPAFAKKVTVYSTSDEEIGGNITIDLYDNEGERITEMTIATGTTSNPRTALLLPANASEFTLTNNTGVAGVSFVCVFELSL